MPNRFYIFRCVSITYIPRLSLISHPYHVIDLQCSLLVFNLYRVQLVSDIILFTRHRNKTQTANQQGLNKLIGATNTPSSLLYAPPTAVSTSKNEGAFSSLFSTILSRSFFSDSAPSFIRSSPPSLISIHQITRTHTQASTCNRCIHKMPCRCTPYRSL